MEDSVSVRREAGGKNSVSALFCFATGSVMSPVLSLLPLLLFFHYAAPRGKTETETGARGGHPVSRAAAGMLERSYPMDVKKGN